MLRLNPQDLLNKSQRFEISADKGIINVGSAEENDIVVNDPDIRPYHFVFLCGEKPYQILLVDPLADLYIRNVAVHSMDAVRVTNFSEFRFGNYVVHINQGVAAGADSLSFSYLASSPQPVQPERVVPSTGVTLVEGIAGAGDPSLAPLQTPAEINDEVILLELPQNSAAIHVQQNAAFQVNIINGGPIVATFELAVQGLPAEWVSISPARLNLIEGGRASFSVNICPPRHPGSLAGTYQVRFCVSSPNHPQRLAVREASLTIAPYYDYTISDLQPLRSPLAWRKRAAAVKIHLQNRGNSPTRLRLSAADDSSECQIHLRAQNGLMQPGQAEYTLPAGETLELPLQIAPLKRILIAFSSRQLPYRVSVTQLENETLTRFSMGTLLAKPLIGMLEVILLLLFLLVSTVYLFTPRVSTFSADNSVIGVGQSTTLHWKAFFLTHDVQISGLKEKTASPQGSEVIFPAQTVNAYTLTASTWLWKMLNLEPIQKVFTILAVPGQPQINTFMVSENNVLVGDSVILRWSVANATKVLLTVNGVTDVFEDPQQFNGERNMLVESDTLISIEAINALGAVVKSTYIVAKPPSIVIEKFEVSKTAVYKGEQITIRWKISGTGMENGGEVLISAFPSALPLDGELTFFPEASMEFVLTVKNRQAKEVRILPVGVLDPAAPPEPPVINFFSAAPDTLVGSGKVELSWSVSGAFQSIQIDNAATTTTSRGGGGLYSPSQYGSPPSVRADVVAKDLAAQGFKTITVSKSGTYVLTATNAGKGVGKELKITVNPALLTAKLSIKSISRSTNLSMGDVITVSITAESPTVSDPPPTGTVVISDGTSSCSITLPAISCELTLKTPGNKFLYATYMGDSKYVQSKSKAYTPAFYVQGNDLTVTADFSSAELNPVMSGYYFSEKINLVVKVAGSNPLTNPDGIIRVRRLCDTAASVKYIQPCTDSQIGYYKLKPEDGGVYKFTGNIIDQKGGKLTVQVYYTEDSFYNDTTAKSAIDVSSSWAGPVTLEATGLDSITWTAGQAQQVTFKVQDTNANAIVSPPRGTLQIRAVNNSSSAMVYCDSTISLTALSTSASTGSCGLTPSEKGTWTLRGTFTPTGDDWHGDLSDQTIDSFEVNATPAMTLLDENGNIIPITTVPDLVTKYANRVTVNISQTDNTDTGTLACAAVASQSGIDSCTCSQSGAANSLWYCSIKPVVTSFPTVPTIEFRYTAGANSHKNDSFLSRAFNVIKADTTLGLAVSPVDTIYSAGSKATLTASIVHASTGGDAPAAGAVTVQVGPASSCDASSGMGSSALATYSMEDISAAKTLDVTLLNSWSATSDLAFCARYAGAGAYNASPWVKSATFNVTSISTKINITDATKPNPSTSPYTVGAGLSFGFEVKSDSGKPGDANPNAGTLSVTAGTGSCSASTGMSTGVIETKTAALGSSVSFTLSSSYVVGSDVLFCYRYVGTGNYSSSPYVATDAIRVKAQPTIDNISAQTVTISPSSTVNTSVQVVVHSVGSLATAQLKILDADDNVICNGSGTTQTGNVKCTYVSAVNGSGLTTYTYNIAANAIVDLSMTAKYLEDAQNKQASAAAFSLISRYSISMGSISVANTKLWAYTEYENETSNIMLTTMTGSISFANFTGYTGYNTHSLTASVVPIDSEGNHKELTSGTCLIHASGSIDCSNVSVDDSTVKAFLIVVAPSSGDEKYFTGTLSAQSGAVNVVQNIITSSDIYGLSVVANGCSGGGIAKISYIVTGYAANNVGEPGYSIADFSNMYADLFCDYDGDGDSAYDDLYSGKLFTSNSTINWSGSGPYKFTFSLNGAGCRQPSEKIDFTLRFFPDITDPVFDIESYGYHVLFDTDSAVAGWNCNP